LYARRCGKWRATLSILAICLSLTLAGCGSTTQRKPGSSLVETVVAGLTGELGEKGKQAPQTIAIRLDASANLNADDNGNGLATVMRIYQLRDLVAFLSLPHAAHWDSDRERAVLGNALIESREFTLVPGQTLHFKENLNDSASHLGIVALFRKRAGQRWRLAFASADAARSGIAIGVHACAMTSNSAVPLGTNIQDAFLLSTAPCR
jgi:type VI secretion system protein VasD